MDSDVKITAEVLPHDRGACRFTVDRFLVREGSFRFREREKAKALSPLAERLFAIEGITSVFVQGSEVVVTHEQPVDWKAVGPLIGKAIREHAASGEPAVKPEAMTQRTGEDSLRDKVQKVLDEQINPAVASHGGFITLVDVQNQDVYIRMGGGCQGCGMASATLRDGVDDSLRAQIPELKNIWDVTDHDAGESPYYSGASSNTER